MQFKGFKRALLSTARNLISRDFENKFAEVGRLEKPTLLIWGKHDKVVPYANHVKVLGYIPKAKFISLDKSAHLPPVEQTVETADAVASFFRQR